MIKDTPIVNLVIELAFEHAKTFYKKNEFDKSKFERSSFARSGNLAFVTQIGHRLQQLAQENITIATILSQNPRWDAFQKQFLFESVQNMLGVLYDDPRSPTADEDEAGFLGRLVGKFKKSSNDVTND